MFSLKRSTAGAFAVPFRVLSGKEKNRQEIMSFFLELVPLRGAPESRTLVPLSGSFQNFRSTVSLSEFKSKLRHYSFG